MEAKKEAHKHSETSASSADRWLACPGSVGMCRLVPAGESSEAAERGTRAHKWAEWILQTSLEVGELEPVLDVASRHPDPDDMYEHVSAYCQFVWADIAKRKPKNVQTERKLTLSEEHGLYGTADVCYVVSKDGWRFARVIDLKTGRNFVDEKDSAQLPFYGAALVAEVKRSANVDVDEVEVTIFQPLAADEDGEVARSVTLTAKQVREWTARLAEGSMVAREMAAKPQSEWELKVGPHCKYCAAKAICTAYAREASTPEFELTSPPENLPVPSTLTDDQVANVLQVMKPARDFFKAVERYAIGRAKEGKPIPGWGVEATSGKRKWSDETEKVAEEIALLGVEPYRKTLRTITDVEKDLRKLKVKRIPEHLAPKKVGGLKLVSLIDGRTGLTRDEIAAIDFDDIEELEEVSE